MNQAIPVLRFMSAAEAIKLLDGQTLHNRTDHGAAGWTTDSVGFCFALIGDSSEDTYAIYHASKILSGITIMDVCLIGNLHKNAAEAWKLGYGKYATGKHKEFSTNNYSLEDFASWSLYAPYDRNPLSPTYSGNWDTPEFVTSNERWGQ